MNQYPPSDEVAFAKSELPAPGPDLPPERVVTSFEDAIRFDEAIDQALCELIAYSSKEVDQVRNLFLGMLGHDMRNPLDAIQMTAAYLGRLNAGEEVCVAAQRLVNSGARMKADSAGCVFRSPARRRDRPRSE